MTLEFGKVLPSAARRGPTITPDAYYDKQVLGFVRDSADAAAGGPQSPLQGMPSGQLAAPYQASETATYGDAAASAMGRVLPTQEVVAEHPNQRIERLREFNDDNSLKQAQNIVGRGTPLLSDTIPAVIEQTRADKQRQAEGLADQQLRGDRTPVAGPSAHAVDFLDKKMRGATPRVPSRM